MGAPRSLLRATRGPEDGFTLVEVVVAMGIAGLTLLALLGATISGARASLDARINQQAADVLTKTLEDLRSLDYGAVAMADSDLTGDDTIVAATGSGECTADWCWEVPNGVGVEPIVSHPTGAVSPHVSTVTANANNVSFTLRRYVTAPAEGNTVRATAIVEWSLGGSPHSRTSSTVIANTRRGLPLPKFAVSSSGPTAITINPGSHVQLPFIIKNLGARDAFDLRVYSGETAQAGWVFYPDPTCTGGLDPEQLPDPLTMHSGVYVTPDLYPDSITCFIADKVLDVEGTYSFAIRAQSTKQPGATTAVIKAKPVSVVVQAGAVVPTATPTPSGSASPTETQSPTTTVVCGTAVTPPTPPSTYTLRRFVLLNTPPGNTTTVPVNPMQRDDCTVQSTSHAYSTEVSGGVGRDLTTGGSTSSDGGASVAEWRWLAPVITEFSGSATVMFAYQCASGSANFTVALGDWNQTLTSGNYTSRATASSSVTCTGNWRTAEIPLTVSKFSLRSKSGSGAVPTYLDLRIVASTGAQVRLNYDSADAPSTLFIGAKP